MNKSIKTTHVFILMILVVVATVGITYSYLAVKIKNVESESTISVNTGKMIITYENNSSNIVLDNIIPGVYTNKKFTLIGENTSNVNNQGLDPNMYYKVGLVVEENTFSEGALVYELTKDASSSENGEMANGLIGIVPKNPDTIWIGDGYFTPSQTEERHVYNLKIEFKETNENQNEDQGKSFKGYVNISDGEINYFETDSWATIASHVKAGTAAARYASDIGVTREITLASADDTLNGKTYKVRLANNSNYDCTLDSKTACGFVVEFQDIITELKMNDTATNVGGWPGSKIYGYVNIDIYNALPVDLRAVIIDTEVVSGHGSGDKNTSRTDGNWTSTDKLYLLSTKEVWGDCTQSNCYDTATEVTRQLDYYVNLGVVTSDSTKYKETIKQFNGSDQVWWTRTARVHSDNIYYFLNVYFDGSPATLNAHYKYGVAPAFRIG